MSARVRSAPLMTTVILALRCSDLLCLAQPRDSRNRHSRCTLGSGLKALEGRNWAGSVSELLMVRSLLPATACALVLAALAVHAPLAGQATPTESETQPQTEQEKTEAAARWERLQAEAAADRQARQEAQERYEKGVRDSEAAQREYEAATARHQAEVERAQREQADYQRRMEQYRAERGDDDDDDDSREQPAASAPADTGLAPAVAGTSAAADTQPTATASEGCERQTR